MSEIVTTEVPKIINIEVPEIVNTEAPEITIYIDNSANSSEQNPPGYNQWVGGTDHGDPTGIKVLKTDSKLPYKITSDKDVLFTWYYDYGWQSGENITGPFIDQQIIIIPAVSGIEVNCCLPISFFRKKEIKK